MRLPCRCRRNCCNSIGDLIDWFPRIAGRNLIITMTNSNDLAITDMEAVHLRLSEIDSARCDGTQDTLLVFVTASDGTVGVGEVDSAPLVAKAVIEAEPSHLIPGPSDRGCASRG